MNGLALCAGVGGLEIGLHLSIPEYRTVCYVEREAYAAAILATRIAEGVLDDAPIWDDLDTFEGKPWRGVVDLISAGFPCQPWSTAGQRRGVEDDRWLWPSISRIVAEVRPEWVFIENVPGLRFGGGAKEVLAGLASLGFDAEWDVLSAWDEGAPQLRERFYLLAHADGRGQPSELPQICGGKPDANRRSHRGGEGAIPHLHRIRVWEQPVPQPESKEAPESEPDGQDMLANAEGLTQRKSTDETIPFTDKWNSRSVTGSGGWWSTEPAVGRVVDGLAHRLDRLRATGNGAVPAVAARAFRELSDRFR